ncbi:MAG: carboxymuconolactone decarboxylase family protein [Ectothiorhodospiraceae bacterium]|nr:carboxymuconolactone decarboxylase family protein [Chromatiales bacterium]MCP5154918.1 carboxymuconolactone decarboxylase family protein [Ectothiorhodospiraceae bacterium]
MSRLSPLTESDLNPEQRAVLDAIANSPRGLRGLVGPFGVYARVPGVGNAAQALGAAVRFGTTLEENVKEVAICTVGAFHHSKFEFAAHARLAARAGVAEDIVEALREGRTPSFTDARERVAHQVARELLTAHGIADATYAEAVSLLGETRLIELVVTVGYYGLVSLTLNAFRVPLGEGMADPFPDHPV